MAADRQLSDDVTLRGKSWTSVTWRWSFDGQCIEYGAFVIPSALNIIIQSDSGLQSIFTSHPCRELAWNRFSDGPTRKVVDCICLRESLHYTWHDQTFFPMSKDLRFAVNKWHYSNIDFFEIKFYVYTFISNPVFRLGIIWLVHKFKVEQMAIKHAWLSFSSTLHTMFT